MKAFRDNRKIYIVENNTINVYERVKEDSFDLKNIIHVRLCRVRQRPYERVCNREDVIEFVNTLKGITKDES